MSNGVAQSDGGYIILDIRTKDVQSKEDSDPHEDAFNNYDLTDTILKSLNRPRMQKSIPTFLLYDAMGLQLFDKITHLDEYYLTNAERSILLEHADDLADRVTDGSIIFELGSGSLIKTRLILQAMENQKKRVTYYALDLNREELEKSLASLAHQFQCVQLVGLLGTYEQGIPWLKQQHTKSGSMKMVLWLGSSIGNQTRSESAVFLRHLKRTCLQPGDFCVIGFDRRNDASIVSKAYDDSLGLTRQFIINGLHHVNRVLGETLFNVDDFDYDSTYQPGFGRHVAHYRAKRNVNLVYHRQKVNGENALTIAVEKDELIHVEHSYKYNDNEVLHILNAAGLGVVTKWSDPNDLYRLVLAECTPIYFKSSNVSSKFLTMQFDHEYPEICDQDKHLDCSVCQNNIDVAYAEDKSAALSMNWNSNNTCSLTRSK